MLTRRAMMLSGAALLGACAVNPSLGVGTQSGFVTREGTRLLRGGQPYLFAGANIWYGAYLGADTAYGDRARLVREIDRMKSLGIVNLRVLASSEDSPLRNSITPTFRSSGAEYNAALLEGLDFLLAEMAKRDMTAILYLTNFWEWSGGMMTYLYWTNGGRYINMNDPAHPWPEFADFNAAFYTNTNAMDLYRHYVRTLVSRTNSVTGVAYADDPAIMSWQLSNEPRPGGSEAVGNPNLPNYYAWIRNTAALIKSIDPNHLVSTGSEGLQGCLGSEACVVAAHDVPEIDYVTAHIWPQNWSWADSRDLAGTWPTVEANTRKYISDHVAIANRIGRPLVVEEFGFPRDEGSFDPAMPTMWRDRFYGLIFSAVETNAKGGGPLAGSNFWAWGGEGEAAHADFAFKPGDTSYLGDPPHEPQGWYSVLSGDETTHALIRAHAARLATLRN